MRADLEYVLNVITKYASETIFDDVVKHYIDESEDNDDLKERIDLFIKHQNEFNRSDIGVITTIKTTLQRIDDELKGGRNG